MARLAIILLLLCAAPLAAHPFDDRADMIADLILTRDGEREHLRLVIQYRYESIYASYNETYLELDKNRDEAISRTELNTRFQELAKDIIETFHLTIRGEPATIAADFKRFEFANLDDPDGTVDQPGGLPIYNVRIGYFFVFDVQPQSAWGPGEHPVEFLIASQRIMVSDASNQLRVWDDRGTLRRAVTSVRHDRTAESYHRVRFVWDFESGSTTGPPKPPDETPKPPDDTPKPPDDAPKPPDDTPTKPPEISGKQQLLETDAERHDPDSIDNRIMRTMVKLREGSADPWVWLLVLATMFVWGAQHALMPGHGKTLVAAYLIGTKGRSSDALFLGLVVTAAHTSGVFMLLGGAWAASEIWPGVLQNPEQSIANWISFAVGLTILILGVGLVLKRAGGGHHEHDIFGRHVHPHDHDHTHDSDILTPVPDHDHGHDHGHDHHHDHHHHDHHHGHDHHHHHHHERDPSRMTRGEILRLGILGGLVPCPSAFVIGMLAFKWQMYLGGLVLVTVFSLGLACVLGAIGLMLVRSKDYMASKPAEKKSRLRRIAEDKLPVFGALVIALLGATITLLAMIRMELIDPTRWSI